MSKEVRGRGAYVHLIATCLSGLDGDILERALCTKIHFEDAKVWLKNLRFLAQKRILESIGLARRSGTLLIGLDNIFKRGTKSKQQDTLVFCAEDLANASLKKCDGHAHIFCSGKDLGKAVGCQWVGAVSLGDGHHKDRACFWWNLWQQLSFVV